MLVARSPTSFQIFAESEFMTPATIPDNEANRVTPTGNAQWRHRWASGFRSIHRQGR
jgi:hypothetical protein